MKLRLLSEHYTQLKTQLIMDTSAEQGCFALVQPIQLGSETLLLTKEIIPLGKNDFAEQRDDFLSFKPETMLRIVRQAQKANLSIIMIHTHPGCDQSVDFSKADDFGNLKSFEFFYRMLPQGMHGCLVFSGTFNSVSGRLYHPDLHWQIIDSIEVVGKPAFRKSNDFDQNCFDRQARLLGKAGQGILAKLTVVIVGCGGIGSLIATTLAHSGVGHLVLIDHDVVEHSNLPRLINASLSDAQNKTAKVDVLQNYIQRVNVNCEVRTYLDKLEHIPVDVLALADALVCATDTATSRHHLTELSNKFYVPLLDLGVQFVSDDQGLLTSEVGKVNWILPQTPCLWCCGHVSSELLRRENLSPLEKAQEQRAGYITNVDVPEPSMMPFNMQIAARGCQLLIGNLTGLIESDPVLYEQYSMLGLNTRPLFRPVKKTKRKDCEFCW